MLLSIDLQRGHPTPSGESVWKSRTHRCCATLADDCCFRGHHLMFHRGIHKLDHGVAVRGTLGNLSLRFTHYLHAPICTAADTTFTRLMSSRFRKAQSLSNNRNGYRTCLAMKCAPNRSFFDPQYVMEYSIHLNQCTLCPFGYTLSHST